MASLASTECPPVAEQRQQDNVYTSKQLLLRCLLSYLTYLKPSSWAHPETPTYARTLTQQTDVCPYL